jgi:formyltetrahydrofolate synthetase
MSFRPVTPESPVPPDIVVADSVQPLPIQEIAREAGILDEELELYGKHKAKVCLVLTAVLNARRLACLYSTG